MDTMVNFNILPLGSYDNLISMYWLEYRKTIINYLHKSFDCIYDEVKYHTINGIYRPINTRQISVVQLKKCIRKGCRLYAIKILED